ncbi:DUF397 domain-containing protein [Streptomyces sp. CBMA29]|uniref:DUF397 domain-containing protein n=1 Tax=Streptomyces sp. CBMA29 TaxID=1896314 RepID=UPI001661EC26|nr:DUF397 domain-containing protein [Streptomyces sp. CBMA29]MBD0738531.1 DUF397 domain-containing protein [Streptomyces sp. CBMA29]
MTSAPDVVSPFKKSSYSGAENNCLEVAATSDGGRTVRDSKDPGGPTLTFTPTEWSAFLTGTRNGEFAE